MESPNTSPSQLRRVVSFEPLEQPTKILSAEQARELLEAHSKSPSSQPLITKYLTTDKDIFQVEDNQDEFFYVLKASREIERELTRGDISVMSVACNAIEGLYAKYQGQLNAAWGDGRVQMLTPLHEDRTSTRSPESHSPSLRRPDFESQGQVKEIGEEDDVSTFEKLQTFYMQDAKFNFSTAGLNGNGNRIIQIYDAEDESVVTKDDFVIFQAVFENLMVVPENTIQGKILESFIAIWKTSYSQKCIPFTFEQAKILNELLGKYKIRDLKETFSMLQLPEDFFSSSDRNILVPFKDLIKALFDGVPGSENHESAPFIKQCVAKIFKDAGKDTPEGKIRDRLQQIVTREVRKGSGKDPIEMGLGKVILMGAAAVLTLYLANRFVIQPAWQWYRGKNPPVKV